MAHSAYRIPRANAPTIPTPRRDNIMLDTSRGALVDHAPGPNSDVDHVVSGSKTVPQVGRARSGFRRD